MATVLGVGVGIFILAFIWALTFLLCLVFSRSQGGLKINELIYLTRECLWNAVIGIFLGALAITLILVFFPREDPSAAKEVDFTIYDHTLIGRTVLVSFMGLFVLVGVVLVFIFHWMDPMLAKPIKRRY
ncbi:transmembrane protein 218-like isoform X1 [Ptychodera flava]|uniref:transmembrane protein 218-like isoform X1 n=1 Tax=Ptychodera flava TaxID=63121 RepID=UPI00396A23D0